MELKSKRCVPCEGGVPTLTSGEISLFAPEVPAWKVDADQRRLRRTFTLPGFVPAMSFVNQMAELAEAEGHHPDFCVHHKVVEVSLSTHAIGGLSENDFIIAAKIDQLIAPA